MASQAWQLFQGVARSDQVKCLLSVFRIVPFMVEVGMALVLLQRAGNTCGVWRVGLRGEREGEAPGKLGC